MKKIVALLALATAVPCFADTADEWIYLGADKDYAAYFKDVERTGDLSATLWLKVIGKTKDAAFGTATNHTEISCKSKTYRLLGGATYSRNGRKIAEIPAGQPADWKPFTQINFLYRMGKEICETLSPGTDW